ncbi:glycosyltransferase [Turicibacter sanguinis]|uniref:glycosyltransferase family protein n=1 Tax=Turicibacter sanguinis TaxID=154288 RepID=UPI0018A9ACAD|nr:glycosyltransferase [Turicibacter sanguinis]MDB8558256.1 glycosyltransferase [Turicibacter sanguinis]MDB8561032.1 glycosyltransferase [Turicibacter sanguinis]
MEKTDLIILPFHDCKKWEGEGYRTRDAHLFKAFSTNSRVKNILVINRPVSRAEMIYKKMDWKTNCGELVHREKNWQICSLGNNAYYMDFYLPDIFSVFMKRKAWWHKSFNNLEVQNAIRKAMKIINMNNTTILLQNPMAIGIVGQLNEDLFVFDAIDNWLCHPQNKRYSSLLNKNYEFIDNNANVITMVSKNLEVLFKKNKNVNWIPNAVDKNYFKSSIKLKEKQEDNIIIGYIGKIQDRIDFNLVEMCLKQYPKYNFEFYGPILSCHQRIKQLSENYNNIQFKGDIHYDKLPEIMKKIDITIIPHICNEFTESMNPLKLYEYLAAGKPVVTTSIAGVDPFLDYIFISKSNSDFVDNIHNCVKLYSENKDFCIRMQDAITDEYTWNTRAEEMIELIMSQKNRSL